MKLDTQYIYNDKKIMIEINVMLKYGLDFNLCLLGTLVPMIMTIAE